ncbi:MAG TPA: hypothetical protein GX707_07895 [Epulopiscium sp.]|nr:hypothetical protein [Candidatus Epulonipiscium sp.]
MNFERLYNTLLQIGIPVTYSHFKKQVALPYIIYLANGSNNFGADNKVYYGTEHMAIELYTENKDTNQELKVESLLDENEWFYEKYETYIDTEKMYQVRYEL